MALPDGLYDLLLTEGLDRSLAGIDPSSVDMSVLKGGAAEFLADVITRQLAAILDDFTGDDADKATRQLELVNELLVTLRQRFNASAASNAVSSSAAVVDLVASPLRVLRAVRRNQQFPVSPEIGLGGVPASQLVPAIRGVTVTAVLPGPPGPPLVRALTENE